MRHPCLLRPSLEHFEIGTSMFGRFNCIPEVSPGGLPWSANYEEQEDKGKPSVPLSTVSNEHHLLVQKAHQFRSVPFMAAVAAISMRLVGRPDSLKAASLVRLPVLEGLSKAGRYVVGLIILIGPTASLSFLLLSVVVAHEYILRTSTC